MLPDQVLSTVPVLGYYLSPDNLDVTKLADYELGGIGLQDPSAGLQYQIWRVFVQNVIGTNTYDLYIEAPNTAPTLMFNANDISEVSLAFDQNMNPFIAFVEAGQAKFWWYDTNVNAQVFTDLAVGVRSPRACLDDKRAATLQGSDIILVYVRSDNVMCFRAQRDRYLVEYVLLAGVTQDVVQVGMSTVNRVQIGVGLLEDPVGTINHRYTVSGDRRVTVSGDIRRVPGVSYG